MNIWEGHFLPKVRRDSHFPAIDDVVTYVQKARDFATRDLRPGMMRDFRLRPDGIREAFTIDLNSGEFAVQVLTGPEAGAMKMKTYFYRGGTPGDRLLYFVSQLVR